MCSVEVFWLKFYDYLRTTDKSGLWVSFVSCILCQHCFIFQFLLSMFWLGFFTLYFIYPFLDERSGIWELQTYMILIQDTRFSSKGRTTELTSWSWFDKKVSFQIKAFWSWFFSENQPTQIFSSVFTCVYLFVYFENNQFGTVRFLFCVTLGSREVASGFLMQLDVTPAVTWDSSFAIWDN